MRIRNYKTSTAMILVLNSDYLPVNVTSFKKAFKLIYKGKAEIVEEDGDVYTYNKKFSRPSVIRLVKYVNIPYRKVVMSRENIFKRDEYTCTYCGSHKNLTIDHIHPKSKGGGNNWDNLITSCFQCNAKKGDRTLEQAGMKLSFTPFKPNPLYFICKSHKNEDKWQPYLMF